MSLNYIKYFIPYWLPK